MRKRWLLLIIAAFLGLALLAVDRYTSQLTPGGTDESVREADYYGSQLLSRQYNADGQLAQTFTAAESTHYPGIQSTFFSQPQLEMRAEDGEQWHEFACSVDEDSGQAQGCAGSNPVLSRPENGIDPTDPESAGGDGFDLADVGLSSAQYVRITDTGTNGYAGVSGGFDLDAVAVVHAGETTHH